MSVCATTNANGLVGAMIAYDLVRGKEDGTVASGSTDRRGEIGERDRDKI